VASLKKEFYFVRHGQTDHNLSKKKEDHHKDIPLNETGRNQAKTIEPIIASLPIRTVCSSPMKRAKETKEIITERLLADHHEIDDLGECTARIWQEMSKRGMYSDIPIDGEARLFMDRVRKGIDHVLSLPGPLLIVAHGGVHWAACCLMCIENHEWAIANCAIVHFSMGANGKWLAKKL
jgi:probable phosphoglycerate mutase